MRKRLWFGVLVISLLLMLLGCKGKTPTPSAAAASETTATPTAPPTVAPAAAPVTLVLGGPEVIEMAAPMTPVSLDVRSTVPLKELAIEVVITPQFLQVMDVDNETPGVQVLVQPLPEEVQVLQNEVDANNVLRLRFLGIGDAAMPALSLAMIPVQPRADGVAEVAFQAALATAPDGTAVMVQPAGVLKIKVGEGVAQTTPAEPPPAPVTSQPAALPAGLPVVEAGVYYRIQAGQNLFRVGLTFGSTAEAIARANGITDINNVPAGKLLRVPVAPPRGQAAYFVSPQETFYSIARHFGFRMEDLGALNNIAAPYPIQAGQWIILRP